MTEIERLMLQKKEIDERIKALKHSETVVDCVKLERSLTLSYGNRWRVAVANDSNKGMAWHSVILGETREDVVAKLPSVIKALQGLYEKVKE